MYKKSLIIKRITNKTILGLVELKISHNKYLKTIKKQKIYMIHDELNQCNPKDIVLISSCRPYSKKKKWIVKSIIKKKYMIQSQTYLNIIDNTGAKQIMCIRVLGKNHKLGKIGDIIIGVVKKAQPNMAIKRSQVVRAIIVRTKNTIKRLDGTYIRFQDNAAVIINNENLPKGTRIFGPIAKEIKEKNFTKIISLANEII